MKTRYRWTALMVPALLLWSSTAQARIKLVALPEREAISIRLDNPAATLIEEERVLTLQAGVNSVDFSWNGVSIDIDSIRLTPLDHPGEVTLLNVSYPPNEAALVWELSSTAAREERVRISYLLRDIDRLITYTLTANKEETELAMNSYLVLRNFSGEDFTDAAIMLDYGDTFRQSVGNEGTRQMLFFTKDGLALKKVWEFDASALPWDPEQLDENVGIPVRYEIANTAANKLGADALWAGKVRVFQEDGHGGTIFLGEDNIPVVPVGDEMKVYIGDSRDIVVTQRKMKEERANIRRNKKGEVVLYDTDEVIRAELENFKDTPAALTVIQHIRGQWDMDECNMPYTRKDAGTLEFEITLPPNGKKELVMQYHRRNIR
ncbi:MAG: hypothetical protein EOM20_14460 [Spartobacteria bacterium]|nr:hypothetical protein [Spartobacteria bacterium]